MRSLFAPVAAALSASHAVLATLVKIDFPSGTVALNSSNMDLVYAGTTYKGAYGLGAISPITDRPGELPGLQLELSAAESANLALALDSADEVQGALVTIRTAILDNTTYQVLSAELDWTGYADTMVVAEDATTATVGLSAESKAVDLLRGTPLVYGDADQQSIYPGDRGFEYVVDQADKPVVWPSRQWFYR